MPCATGSKPIRLIPHPDLPAETPKSSKPDPTQPSGDHLYPISETHALVEIMLLLRKEDVDNPLDPAAERGAERYAAHLGLESGHAARRIRELRHLLEAWRDAHRTDW